MGNGPEREELRTTTGNRAERLGKGKVLTSFHAEGGNKGYRQGLGQREMEIDKTCSTIPGRQGEFRTGDRQTGREGERKEARGDTAEKGWRARQTKVGKEKYSHKT